VGRLARKLGDAVVSYAEAALADPVLTILLYFILPLWFAAGFADWLCHRAANIESTAGAKESLIHLLMFGEMALPLLAALFLEINSLIIALMIVAFLAHEATALWDVSYAVTRRAVSPFEQHVHSFLEMLPLMAAAFVAVLHWPQFLALFGLGSEPARFDLIWKRTPLPIGYIAAVLTAALLLEALPYLEELWRCLRTAQGRLVPPRRRVRDPR
jgi:hypothetical protein